MPYCSKYGVTLISMIAPTSDNRIQMIASEAEGFIYCVSSMGVTGVRTEINNDVENMIKLVKEVKDIPCAIGFGISTPEQAKRMAAFLMVLLSEVRLSKSLHNTVQTVYHMLWNMYGR